MNYKLKTLSIMENLKEALTKEWQRMGYTKEQAKEMAELDSEKPEKFNSSCLQENLKKEWQRMGYSESQAEEMAANYDGDLPENITNQRSKRTAISGLSGKTIELD